VPANGYVCFFRAYGRSFSACSARCLLCSTSACCLGHLELLCTDFGGKLWHWAPTSLVLSRFHPQALHDIITSKRHRTWQKILETIMFKYVDLCLELKKGRYAKDGLIHYRNICQQVNVGSLEEVIKYFLKAATDKAEEAQIKAQVKACVAVKRATTPLACRQPCSSAVTQQQLRNSAAVGPCARGRCV
jgi:hypothetical protein